MRASLKLHMRTAAVLVAVALLIAPASAAKAKRAPKSGPKSEPAPAPTLRDVARDFEARRLIAGAERVTFLRGTNEAVQALLSGNVEENDRLAARMLAGTLSFELGDYPAAGQSFERAAELAGKSSLAADAEFARIQSLEATGQDD